MSAHTEDLLVTDPLLWRDGPPHDMFAKLRNECPVHWTPRITGHGEEAGYWSVTIAEDAITVSRDWQTYSSEMGGITATNDAFPLELSRAMLIGMDPPKHDRLKALFQEGFAPRRIAQYESTVRAIVCDVFDEFDEMDTYDAVNDIAQPVVARVIGSFMGLPPEEDEKWAALMNAALGSSGAQQGRTLVEETLPDVFERCQKMIASRRATPTDDLASVLVHAEVDGERLTDQEIAMGIFLFLAAGNDSTKATFCHGLKALIEQPDQKEKLIANPGLIPQAVEEALRMFPAFAHFRRTATRDTELHGQTIKKGDKVVMWYVSTNRDESLYEDVDRFDVERAPSHQAFGAGGRHFCLGAALARLELQVLFEETLSRFPEIDLAGAPTVVESAFVNQMRTMPVRLSP
ncbi:MAG: cytochrome P450 [Gaiellaceae bacterium]